MTQTTEKTSGGARKWGRAQVDLDYIAGQVASFSCGLDGCSFTFGGLLPDWLELRDEHYRTVHRGFKPKRKKIIGIGKSQMVKA